MRGVTQEMFEGLNALYTTYGDSPFGYKDVIEVCPARYPKSFFRILLEKKIICSTRYNNRDDTELPKPKAYPSQYRLTSETIDAITRWRERHGR